LRPIECASRDTFTWVTGKYDYVNPPALKRLIVAGALLRPFPQEVLEGCYVAANELYADLFEEHPVLQQAVRESEQEKAPEDSPGPFCQSMIRKSMPSGYDPMGWEPVFP
jgi:TRAP-type mannitol/chloroaromatic compound transport system substrate-binding protein